MMKRLAFNTASNVITLVIKLSITFIMTPMLIKNLGRYDYGIWEMIGAVIGYMGMLDLGIRPAVSRFASRFIALDDEVSLRILYATAWYFLLAIGVLIAVILSMWGIFFPEHIAEIPTDTQRYTWLLLILAAQLLITFPSYAAESYMESYQEYYLKNNITIVNSFIGFTIVYYYITPSNALILLAAVNALGVCSKYIFLVWFMQYRRPFLKLKREYFSVPQFKELLSFGFKSMISGISSRIENATDSLVIGTVLGPASVLLYSVPAALLSQTRGICMTITHVFMPYISGLNATNDHQKIRVVYIFGSKLMVFVPLLLIMGILTVGEDFLRLWVGADIAESSRKFLFIIAAFTLIPMLNPLSVRYLQAIDEHVFFAKWQPAVALANLILSVILIYPLGIAGVALGSLIPAIIFQPILLYVCCKHLNASVWEYVSKVLLPWIIPSIGMVVSIFGFKHLIPITNFFWFLIVASLGALVFVGLSCFLVFSVKERSQLFGLVRRKKVSIGD